uniref:Jumonji domain-containing protein 4 n=1 Tax=Mesocestoides corti TaxID=53468 RepID=A0A5K3F826_MESCO
MDCDDDFRFVYIGPKHTWTPLHSDVYCSYSWSANIVGKKRWWLLPPGEEKKLKGFSCGSPLPDLRDQTLASPGEKHSDLPRCYVFDQQPGEISFVPSGWYHQVVNMTDCVSINNNWLNACNIGLVWQHLQSQLKEVKRSCADVQSTPGWDEACQECLKAWEGWDFAEFFLLLKYIIISRWLFLTPEEVRQRLPRTTVSTSPDTKITFSQLETQVDTLFSETAEADKALLDWLIAESWSDDVWKRCLISGDSVQGVRQHDLIEAARTMKSMLGNEDVRRLSLHTRGPAAWIWKDWPVFTQS